MSHLKKSVSSLGGVHKRYSPYLEKLGIIKLEDFLYHVPFRYDDFSIISKIGEIQPGETVTVRGEIKEIKNQYTRRFFTIQKGLITDETGEMEIVWFNQPYIAKNLNPGDKISVSGKVEKDYAKLSMKNPDYEIGEGDYIHTGRLVPIYRETRGVHSKWMRKQVFSLLNDALDELEEFMPDEIIQRNNLEDIKKTLWKVHFPDSLENSVSAKKRLAFDELLITQAASKLRKMEWDRDLEGFAFKAEGNTKKVEELINSLPFELTNAQKRTVDEIFEDLTQEKPMNRLLEGDVGSGKTVVAAIAMYLAHLNGFQSVLMAPTEILATQHYKSISEILAKQKVKVAIATGSKKEKTDDFDILVGTHAVLFGKIKYKKLGIVIIDEQQRFGVEQRSLIRKKGKNPHVLTMTATPIPRTIALTLYGDLSLSILDEMPKGRKIIKTWLVPNFKRDGAYDWIKKQIKANKSQVFIVCPFIEESESMATVKAAKKEFEHLQNEVFKDFKLGLLHGKLKAKEKDEVLSSFRNKKTDILVATPVVEVGIDIPNADVMLIEAAERFGLSQLHQLRGRVGRGDRQSYCLLFTESLNETTSQRLRAMEQTNIGAELAELDLKLRGPGEIFGTQQHGRRSLKIADFSDFDLIKKTKEEAERIIEKIDKYPKLLAKIEEINIKSVSPD